MLKKSISTLILVFFVLTINSQSKNSDNGFFALKKVLGKIELAHGVKFSYNSKLINNKKVVLFTTETSLDQKLSNLEKQTFLSFTKINERYIVIKEKEPTSNHTICGVLIDVKINEPIAFASVFIKGTLRGTTTDEKGNFQFKNTSSNQVIVTQSVGYVLKETPVYLFLESPCLSIQLTEENIQLEEVLISDYITQGISKKQNGSIQVSPTKLGILPGLIEPDVLLSLQLLPGIQSPSETASGLHIRGSSPDQNLVLFDGIKMFQSGHFFGLISSFNPYVTKKINVFRNGTSSKFGDRIGGVLDISSGEDVPEFEAGFGLNLTHADAFLKTPLFNNKVGLVFSARRSITDLVETITYKNFSESVFQNTRILDGVNDDTNRQTNVNNDFYFKDYNLKIVADVTKSDKISFSNLYNKNQLNYTSENQRFRERLADNIGYQNKGFRVDWKKNWSSNILQSFDVHLSEYQFDYDGKRIKTRNNVNDNETQEFVIKNHVKDWGINFDISHNLSDKLQLNYGYQFSKTDIFYLFQHNLNIPDNKLLSNQNTSNTTQALFSEVKYQNKDKAYVSLGLRANRFSAANEWFFEPRLFASLKVSEPFTIKTSGEIKNQAVSQIIEYRNNGIGLENNIWAVANSEIPILNSKQLSVGFLYQKNGWNLDVDFYQKKIKGLTLMTDDLANNTQANRVPFYISGESNISGIDLLLKKRFGNYRSWISYSYSKTKQEYKELNNGNSFNGINAIPHALTWSHTYKLNQLELSLGWKIRSGIPYTEATGTFIDNNNNLRVSYGNVNEKSLPNYQKFDFSSTYKFHFSKKKNVEGKIGISLLNVLNKKNILDRTYELKVVNNPGNVEEQKLVKTDRLSLGFTPNVVFRLTF